MKEEITKLIKDLDKKIYILESNLNFKDVKNSFAEGRVTAFCEIRNKLYEIIHK